MNRQDKSRKFDCIVCGSCTVDVLVHPVNLQQPIGVDQLHRVDPIGLAVGGIVSNAGITLSRLGLRTAAFSAVGKDRWGELVHHAYADCEIDSSNVLQHADLPTSVSVVTIDKHGDRSFIHSQGAPKAINGDDYIAALPMFANSRAMLLGYYPLLPNLLDELAGVFAAIRNVGCLTALDAAGGGGTMQPLAHVLPNVDIYCPSLEEAKSQTGRRDPKEILKTFRDCGAPGLIGVKLGPRGAMLSPVADEFVDIPPVEPPTRVVDTTGAGDVFFAALIAALLDDRDVYDAGRIAAAAGAVSVTAAGATTAAIHWDIIDSLL
ncbi:MAG: carbohydrate kinase family protein [Pirellulaceae bacterium]|nr:carbohydrate kinase family protein [Pirellulaceae bacterium]